MQLDIPGASANGPHPWGRLAFVTWTGILLFVCVRGALWPLTHTLYPTYAYAGGNWVAGTDAYYDAPPAPHLDQYRYSPLVTALLVPFHLLPDGAGSVLWRLLNGAVFLGGFAWWLRSGAPVAVPPRQQAIHFLLLAPLALSSLNNGQSNPLVIGLLLAAAAAAAKERWGLAALAISLACALKVYPIALGLLLAVVYPRRFAPRLVLALVLTAGLPFLLQHPDYVARQYSRWYEKVLEEDGRHDAPLGIAYRDLWLLFRRYAPIGAGTYLAIRLVAAAGCAVVCVAGRCRGWSLPRLLLVALALGTCWMMLCGPTTESCTYVLLAPALAWGVAGARLDGWPAPASLLALVSFVLFAGVQLTGLSRSASVVHALGLHPLAALLLTGSYLIMAVRALARPEQAEGAAGLPLPARAA
jgi:hypothetical protein